MKTKLGLLALVAAATAILAALPAAARHESLAELRVSVITGGTAFVGASQSFHVRHGWTVAMDEVEGEEGWKRIPADERQEFLDESITRFELHVNGVPVEMQRILHNTDGGPLVDGRIMSAFWFHQFDAGELPVGTYTLTGRWYGDVNDDDVSELALERTLTLFVAPTVPE